MVDGFVEKYFFKIEGEESTEDKRVKMVHHFAAVGKATKLTTNKPKPAYNHKLFFIQNTGR